MLKMVMGWVGAIVLAAFALPVVAQQVPYCGYRLLLEMQG